MSRVDIIIPCYRYAHYLSACLESILSQDVDLKVLILDDASPDNTPEVASDWASRDSRVEWRRHAENKGHIATYNEGLEWSSGDYTLLISADDLLTPDALQRAVSFMDSHPSAGMVYGRAIRFESSDHLPPYRVGDGHSGHLAEGKAWLHDFIARGKNFISSPEVITRTSLQHQLGGYRNTLPHTADFEMWMRFAAHADVGILDSDQAYYRIHGDNMSLQQFVFSGKDQEQTNLAFETAFAEYGDRMPQVNLVTPRNVATLLRRTATALIAPMTDKEREEARQVALAAPSGFRPAWRLRNAYHRYRRRIFGERSYSGMMALMAVSWKYRARRRN